jgi:hypothetical protein
VRREPRLEVFNGRNRGKLRIQLVEHRGELRGIGQVNRFRKELPRRKM